MLRYIFFDSFAVKLLLECTYTNLWNITKIVRRTQGAAYYVIKTFSYVSLSRQIDSKEDKGPFKTERELILETGDGVYFGRPPGGRREKGYHFSQSLWEMGGRWIGDDWWEIMGDTAITPIITSPPIGRSRYVTPKIAIALPFPSPMSHFVYLLPLPPPSHITQ